MIKKSQTDFCFVQYIASNMYKSEVGNFTVQMACTWGVTEIKSEEKTYSLHLFFMTASF